MSNVSNFDSTMGFVFWDNAFLQLGYRRNLTILAFVSLSGVRIFCCFLGTETGGTGWGTAFGSVIFLDRRWWRVETGC